MCNKIDLRIEHVFASLTLPGVYSVISSVGPTSSQRWIVALSKPGFISMPYRIISH